MKAPLHKKAHRAIISVHAKHLNKLQRTAHHSRTFCEVAAAIFTSIETHMSMLAGVCVLWVIVDVVLIITKAEEV